MTECATCDGRTEIYTGRDERETGMPVTVDCPDCPDELAVTIATEGGQ